MPIRNARRATSAMKKEDLSEQENILENTTSVLTANKNSSDRTTKLSLVKQKGQKRGRFCEEYHQRMMKGVKVPKIDETSSNRNTQV